MPLAVKFYNPVTSLCVIRCARDEYRQVGLVALEGVPDQMPPATNAPSCSLREGGAAYVQRSQAGMLTRCSVRWLRQVTAVTAAAAPLVQIWCAVTMLTSIKNRVVLPRLLHLTGTVAACKEAAQKLNAARTAREKLSSQVCGRGLCPHPAPCTAIMGFSFATTLALQRRWGRQ